MKNFLRLVTADPCGLWLPQHPEVDAELCTMKWERPKGHDGQPGPGRLPITNIIWSQCDTQGFHRGDNRV